MVGVPRTIFIPPLPVAVFADGLFHSPELLSVSYKMLYFNNPAIQRT